MNQKEEEYGYCLPFIPQMKQDITHSLQWGCLGALGRSENEVVGAMQGNGGKRMPKASLNYFEILPIAN